MTAKEVQNRIRELQGQIAIKQDELSRKIKRRKEIGEKPESPIKRKIITRYKTEIMQMTDELNNLKTELWGLQEIRLSDSECVW